MCGISFVLENSSAATAIDTIRRMHAPIRHRGPDDEAFLLVDESGFHRSETLAGLPKGGSVFAAAAFRRLNILDLTSAAAQPMLSPSKSTAILFNGEIYNFRDLRRELESLGRVFRSSGDTEVALAAYEEWGKECFKRFEGMWAIVMVDFSRRIIVASRDRFGIKPLYWHREGRRLLLSSEIRQILAAGVDARSNEPLVAMYLRGIRQPSTDETFFHGIRLVPPATWFEMSVDGQQMSDPRFHKYWDLSRFSADDARPPAYEEAVEHFESLLKDAVASHRIADVRVGSLLSGGLDSSTLAVMLSEFSDSGGEDFPTFSFGFRERDPELCEMPYVDAVAAHNGLKNFETTFDSNWVLENTPVVIRALEEPILGMPPLAQYRVLQLCRDQGTTVLFDGQGSDELFGGYEYHQTSYLRDRWRRRRLTEFASELHAISARGDESMMSIFFGKLIAPAVKARLGVRMRLPKWIEPAWGGDMNRPEVTEAISDRGRDRSLVNQQIHFDVRWGNAKTILAFGDKNGMAHSLEVRVPYFDRKLVEYAMTLPDTYKVQMGDRKRILRDVARRRLPRQVTERPRRSGFAVPEARWISNGLRSNVRATLTDSRFAQSSCFRSEALKRFVEKGSTGTPEDSRIMWQLHALSIWSSEFGVNL